MLDCGGVLHNTQYGNRKTGVASTCGISLARKFQGRNGANYNLLVSVQVTASRMNERLQVEWLVIMLLGE